MACLQSLSCFCTRSGPPHWTPRAENAPTFRLRGGEPSPSPAWRWWAFPTPFLCRLGDSLEGVWCVQTLSKSTENSTKSWCEAKTLKIMFLKSRQTTKKITFDIIWYHLQMDSKTWHKKAYRRNGITDTENKLVADKWEGLDKGEGKDWVWDWQVQTVLHREWTSNKVLPHSTVNIYTTEVYHWVTMLCSRNSHNIINQLHQ